MGKTLMVASLAAGLGVNPNAAWACNQWDISGDRSFHQSNNIEVEVRLAQDGTKVTGSARFWSDAFHSGIGGPVEGYLDGNQLKLRINWYLFTYTCYQRFVSWCSDVQEYKEHGIYEGSIDEHGQLQGSNWPFERPDARTSWFADGEATCADRKPVFIPHPTVLLPPAPIDKNKVPRTSGTPPVIFVPQSSRPPVDATRVGGASNRHIGPDIAGTYKSSFGTLILAADGGRYDYKDGRITISKLDGNIVEGTWEQSESGTRCSDGRYYGRFRLTFDGPDFTGTYGYCEQEPTPGNVWDGTRI